MDGRSGRPELVEQAVAAGEPSAVLDPELINVVDSIPMSTLANFGGMSLSHDALDRAVSAWHQHVDPTVNL